MKASKVFHNTHIRVEIKLPTPKHLDMNDACDVLEAIDIIRKEWIDTYHDVNEYLRLEEEKQHKVLGESA